VKIGLQVLFLLISFTIFASFLGKELGEVEHSWQKFSQDVIVKKDLLFKLQANLGYGGFIHDFKNYVLRNNKKYRDGVEKHIKNVNNLVEEYRKDGDVSSEELIALNNISSVFASYTAQLDKVSDFYKGNSQRLEGIRLLDSSIKVDDQPAKNGINTLRRIINENEKYHKEVLDNAQRDFRKILLGVITLFFMFILLVFILNHFYWKRLNLKVIQLTKAKENFINKITHELRTPLNSIIGFSDLMKDESFSSENKEFLGYVKSNSKHLLSLINQVLDFAKINSGKETLNLNFLNVEEKIKGHREGILYKAKDDEIQFAFITKNLEGIELKLDGDKFIQIFLNLISNALKFTPKGGMVKVSLSYQNGNLIFSVSDTGIGITEEQKKSLFHDFQQADEKISSSYGGTGLGLSVSKGLCELMGGKIVLKSKVNEGTTFTVEIPCESRVVEDVLPQKIYNIESINRLNLKILVAEDNKLNRKLILKILERMGLCNVFFAEDGQQACDLVKKNVFDLIFMDVRIPVMDGLTATQNIRALSELQYRPTIIGLSANSEKKDIDKAYEAGMDYYLEKPLQKRSLAKAINKFAS
jgi:signal transduction histidine kinase/CheY-like chemotaxis protein